MPADRCVKQAADRPAPLIGVVDSGVSNGQAVHSSAAFVVEQGEPWQCDAPADRLGHGTRVVEIIQHLAPQARIASANVFGDSNGTSVLQVAAAIDWLVGQGAQLINLSLGLRQDRPLLRAACERALAQGVLLCASSPAQGAAVYPAAYPGVIRATGDARCQHGELVYLNTTQADVAGCVRPLCGDRAGAGASMGCAHVSGHLARLLTQHPDSDRNRALRWLMLQAIEQGPEHKQAEKQVELKPAELKPVELKQVRHG